MAKIIDYFFTPVSPFSYLGHERFVAVAKKYGAEIRVKPIDLGRVFPVSGGLPLKQRAPQRQAYRLLELKRWREFLGLPLNVQPKFFPVSGDLASRCILAALEYGTDEALKLTAALMRAVWVEEFNIAEADIVAAIAREQGFDPATLATRANAPEVSTTYDRLTEEAINRQVFGAPTYIYRDELFWGRDRLDFLDRALAK